MLPGRLLEAAGNRGPRWMAAAPLLRRGTEPGLQIPSGFFLVFPFSKTGRIPRRSCICPIPPHCAADSGVFLHNPLLNGEAQTVVKLRPLENLALPAHSEEFNQTDPSVSTASFTFQAIGSGIRHRRR